MSLRRKYVNSSLKNKTCSKCKKIFPRNKDYFYTTKHRTKDNVKYYDSYCITCRYEHMEKRRRKDGGKKKRKSDLKYRQTERGYLIEKWHSIKKSNKGCLIQSFEEFKACWEKQKETFGEQCPYYSNIKLTRKLGRGNKDKIDSNRILYRIKGNKDNIDILTEHLETDEPTVLASPSMSFGVDLKGEAARFCIIIKCPWPDLGDVRIKEMSKNNKKWYTNKMFTTFVQQCGRCTRAEDDASVTYVLDAGGIRKLLPDYLNLLPTYFIDRFI